MFEPQRKELCDTGRSMGDTRTAAAACLLADKTDLVVTCLGRCNLGPRRSNQLPKRGSKLTPLIISACSHLTQRFSSADIPAAMAMMSAISPSSPEHGDGLSLTRQSQNARVSWMYACTTDGGVGVVYTAEKTRRANRIE